VAEAGAYNVDGEVENQGDAAGGGDEEAALFN
jgi:hypothetical protein